MFNNLIESSSHRKEFKRRGSFVLFTTATYVLLLVITGVVSIYAYDARLEDQTLEVVVTMLPPVDLAPTAAAATRHPENARSSDTNRSTVPERQVAMLSVNHPDVVPESVSAVASPNQPLPEGGFVRITGRDWNPAMPGGNGPGSGGGRQIVQPSKILVDVDPPPPIEVRKPLPIVSKGVITSQAIFLPKPTYSQIAKQLRIQGNVSVQVLIDETGKVISAKAVSGHPFLTIEAQKAALQARFSPTLLGDRPVKVSGVITYNFVMQ
jgi:TonB family protein